MCRLKYITKLHVITSWHSCGSASSVFNSSPLKPKDAKHLTLATISENIHNIVFSHWDKKKFTKEVIRTTKTVVVYVFYMWLIFDPGR